MSDDSGRTGGEEGDGPGHGRHERSAGYRVAFAELLVEFKELEGRVNTSEARVETGFSDMKAAIAEAAKAAAERDVEASKRESRLVKWMAGLAAAATTILGAAIAALAFLR